jgi:hydroxyethylthiazole kinase-like uncharacterized protein yjeF
VIDAFATTTVYAAERALMAELAEGELMERAVAGLAALVRIRLQERGSRRVVALVGPGNNGADALYAVAALAADGFLAGAVLRDGQVHAGALAAAAAAGVVLVSTGTPTTDRATTDRATTDRAATDLISEADIILDGILGIGGRPGVPDAAVPWVAAIPDTAYVIAVDLPSGADPAGEVGDPDGVFADETVTFSVPKPVHLLPATEPACGLLTVIDIGLELSADPPAVRRLERRDVPALWPRPTPRDDKYSRGVVGIVAGSEKYTGAAVLAVTAAANAGAGMIRYVGPPTPEALVRAAVPEAVPGPGRVHAWVLGPGLEVGVPDAMGAPHLEVARHAWASDLPVVVDAGALELVRGPRSAPTLLTPHAGECARLLTRLAGRGEVTRAEVTAYPLRAARELADRTGATVLLKGAWTLVVPPGDGPVFSQCDAPAWLATAGAGDVLAGIAGTLLAAGLDPSVAGALGALVHGLAAETANPGGPVRALMLADALPRTIAALLRQS